MLLLRLREGVPRAARARTGALRAMTVLTLAREQLLALEAPLDQPLAITGRAGTGKTEALLGRAERALRVEKSVSRVVLTTPACSGVDVLRRRGGALGDDPRAVFSELGALALDVLQRSGEPVRGLLDDAEAALAFERASADLFDEGWDEFALGAPGDMVDPEIAGLRTPQRFLLAAFRLIRKLRAAAISLEEFEANARRGLVLFYGEPPNFASPELLLKTPEKYRDSLRVDGAELARQRDRESDLIKVLVALYRRYVSGIANSDTLPATEALLRAKAVLDASSGGGPFAHVFVDDAQDLSVAEFEFVRSLARGRFSVAGDRAQATRGFSGRASRALDVKWKVELTATYRSPLVSRFRAPTQALEALRVADEVCAALSSGVAPGRIAVIARHLASIEPYLEALLTRDVTVAVGGDVDFFELPAVQDGLAALWSVADPYRHDWLMRNLEAPWLRLSDASIAQLCAEPSDAQPLLFEPPQEVEASPSRRRSDRSRTLRLGRNVVCGEADASLEPLTLERLLRFRDARAAWERAERGLDLAKLAQLILSDSVIACAGQGARRQATCRLSGALLGRIERFANSYPFASLHDFLLHVQALAELEGEQTHLHPQPLDAVQVLDVEAARGREFERVFVVDVRAGSLPRYYVPDAFLYYPSLGVIGKENVGDGARAARTAKMTYALQRHSTRERYNEVERRALLSAISRSSGTVTLSAAGAPTKGVAAPELLDEILTAPSLKPE